MAIVRMSRVAYLGGFAHLGLVFWIILRTFAILRNVFQSNKYPLDYLSLCKMSFPYK